MNKLATLLIVIAAIGCSKKQPASSSTGSSSTASKVVDDGKTCPMPNPEGSTERFAVGVEPDHGVPAMAADHGNTCHDDFTANDVVKIDGGKAKIVAEGTFEGTCKEAPTKRTYVAVKPAKVEIDVNALAGADLGKLGSNQPVVLDSKTTDKMAGVMTTLVDRCGDALSAGASRGPVTWTAGAGCDKVAKMQPFDEKAMNTGLTQMQVVAIGPGTCTYTAEWLGAKGDVSITVK